MGAVGVDHVLALSQFSQKIDCGIFSVLFVQPRRARVWIGYNMTDEVAKQIFFPSIIPSHKADASLSRRFRLGPLNSGILHKRMRHRGYGCFS